MPYLAICEQGRGKGASAGKRLRRGGAARLIPLLAQRALKKEGRTAGLPVVLAHRAHKICSKLTC